MSFFCSFGISFAVAGLLLPLIWRLRNHLPLAIPNERSLHTMPIPSVAALALWAGFTVGSIFLIYFQPLMIGTRLAVIGGGAFVLTIVSFVDDCIDLSAMHRLLAQTVVAGLLALSWVAQSDNQSADLFIVLVSIFLIIWMTNLFNFMDGSDGLAVTMAIIGFSALAGAAFMAGFAWWQLPALIVAATLPLWFINFPPAKMFLGDVGAAPLGFLAIGFGGLGVVERGWSAAFVLLVFLPFILDATITLIRRLLHREKVWEAHKTHYYQKLVQLGAGHRGTLLVYGVSMIGCSMSAVFLVRYETALWVVLGGWTIIHLGFFAAIDYHCKKFET
ncbi:MAG: hypothetical protein LBS40_03040 [Burkholderiales bacterium]|nr:hypothetical protein [Burkholderiales bacterium]